MNKNIVKKILFFIVAVILGVILGVGGTIWTAKKIDKEIQSGKDFITMSYLAFEIEEATQQYMFSSDIDTSIYALEHLISFDENFYKKYVMDASKHKKRSNVPRLLEKNFPFDLAVAYVRLGNLLKKKGNTEKAEAAYKKGFEIVNTHKIFDGWKGTEKEIKTIDNLKKFVDELDDRHRHK